LISHLHKIFLKKYKCKIGFKNFLKPPQNVCSEDGEEKCKEDGKKENSAGM
jgi:hypothetical protein